MAVKRAKIIEPDDLKKVFNVIETSSSNQLRDKVAILLSMKAGLRAAEIAGLRWQDVTKANGQIGDEIMVGSHIAKGGRQRIVPINDELRSYLIKLRRERPADDVIRYGDYFPTMNANSMTVWFKRIYLKAGLNNCSSHSGRRTFITALARNANLHNSSLKDVQQIAGHANISTTERYIELSDGVKSLVNSI